MTTISLASSLNVPTLKARYFAHNTLELKFPTEKTLVIDPCLVKEGRFSCGYGVDALEGCDYVFVNHAHGDHVASLGEVYDRFHPLVMAHAATTFSLAKKYDIPYIRFVPFTVGDVYDFDEFKIQIVHGRHNNVTPGNFYVRPSGRIDELCGSNPRIINRGDGLEAELGCLGDMFGSNFVLDTPNNLRVGFFAGNPGMIDPQDRNAWKNLRPDILFAHRARYDWPDFVKKTVDMIEITGARILVPIHIEDAYSGKYDPAEYIDAVNAECERRKLSGRALFMERAVWYEFSTMAVKR